MENKMFKVIRRYDKQKKAVEELAKRVEHSWDIDLLVEYQSTIAALRKTENKMINFCFSRYGDENEDLKNTMKRAVKKNGRIREWVIDTAYQVLSEEASLR